MCGHSTDIAKEELIERKKAEVKGDWQTLHSSSYAKESRLRKKYS
jgi:hypothetical protein